MIHDQFSTTIQEKEQAAVMATPVRPQYATRRTVEQAIERTVQHILDAKATSSGNTLGRKRTDSPISGMFKSIGNFGSHPGRSEKESYIVRERNILRVLVALQESNKCQS